MQDEHASALPSGQDPWQVPGAFSGQDPLLPETPPAGQWAAIEARMRKKRRRGLLWWWLTGILVVGVGAGGYLGMQYAEQPLPEAALPAQELKAEVKAAASAVRPTSAIPGAKDGQPGDVGKGVGESRVPRSSMADATPSAPETKASQTEAGGEAATRTSSGKSLSYGVAAGNPKGQRVRKTRSAGTPEVVLPVLQVADKGTSGSSVSAPLQAELKVVDQENLNQVLPPASTEKTHTAETQTEQAGKPAFVKTAVQTDSLPPKVALQDSTAPKTVVPVSQTEKKPGMLGFAGIGGVSSTDRVLVPKPSSVGGARLTDLRTSRGWQAHLGLTLPALSSERLKTEVSVWGAGISQTYTVVPARQGEPTYTYQNSGDSLIAIPNTPAAEEKRSQLWQFGLQPAIRYRLGDKGWALHAGLGLWSLWQTSGDVPPMKLQLQPQAGVSVPLVWKLELLATARYQSPVSSRFGDLSGRQERFYFGLGLVWRR